VMALLERKWLKTTSIHFSDHHMNLKLAFAGTLDESLADRVQESWESQHGEGDG